MNSQLGSVYAALAAGDRAEARRLLERELQYNPSDGEVWYLLGQAVDDPAQQAEYLARARSLGYVAPGAGAAPRPASVADNWVLPPTSGQPPRRAWWPFAAIILIILGGAGYFYTKVQSGSPPVTAVPAAGDAARETPITVSGSGESPTEAAGEQAPASGAGAQSPVDVVGEQMPDRGNTHVETGTKVEYDSFPPTSGSHWGQWAEWGDQGDASVPDEMLVHNLEHGGVVIAYHPMLVSDAERQQLADLLVELSAINKRVILVQRTDIGRPIALTAWTYRLFLNTVDLDAIRGFYQAHIARGPECVDGRCP